MTCSKTTYAYDKKDRLTLDITSVTNAHTYTYTYDSRDNITLNTETGTSVTMAYDAASRMTTLTSGATVSTLTYDVNGNLLSIWKAGALQADMLYDWENRQWSHTSTDGDTWYLYNAFGKKARIANNFSPTIDQYISWDGEDIVGEMNGENDWKYAFATVDGQMISEIENLSGTPVVKDYLVDFLGSITARTSSTGTIIGTQQRYKPYGSLLSGTITPNQFHWTGNTGSKYTGLVFSEQYNRARHYSSTTGQWTTIDPLWPEEHAYGYVSGNPINNIDSSGERPCSHLESLACYSVCGDDGSRYVGKCTATDHRIGIGFVSLGRFVDVDCKCEPLQPHCKCSPKELAKLKFAQELACSSKFSCGEFNARPYNSDRCTEIKKRLLQGLSCKNARIVVMQKCFSGGDAGHKNEVNEVRKAINKCIAAFKNNKCKW